MFTFVYPQIFSYKIDSRKMETNNQTQPLVKEEEIIYLLEEKLVVNRDKRKLGEIVVRKKVETRFVEVPVRREILIVEKVGKEIEQVAEIDLGEGEVSGIEINSIHSSDGPYNVSSEFISPQAATEILNTLASEPRYGSMKVKIELAVENPEQQDIYQQRFTEIAHQQPV